MLGRLVSATRGAAWTGRLALARPSPRNAPSAAASSYADAASTSEPSASPSPSSSSAGGPRIAIVGGGFGGLYTAVGLQSLFWPRGKQPQVTLIDRSDRFLFKPLMYELLNGSAGAEEVCPTFAQLLAPYQAVRFVQASVRRVVPQELLKDGGSSAGGVVELDDGSSLPYDYLVLALGANADARGVPGVSDYALPFTSLESAQAVKDALDAIRDSDERTDVVIVGGGYSGVELAAVVAEQLRGRHGVKVVTPAPGGILEGSPAGQRDVAQRVLSNLGVQVVAGKRVKQLRPPAVVATAADGSGNVVPALQRACIVDLEDVASGGDAAGASPAVDSHPAGLVLWTAGNSPALRSPEQQAAFPFPTNDRGQLMTEATLRVTRHNRVFALGDLAGPSDPSFDSAAYGNGLPATAQVAFQQADYAAWNIWAAINSRPLLPFRYQHLGSMMALGQLNAAVALPIPVPQPLKSSLEGGPLGPLLKAAGVRLTGADPSGGVTLEGPLAALLRRAAYLYRQPTMEQRLAVAASWVQQVAALSGAGSSSGTGKR